MVDSFLSCAQGKFIFIKICFSFIYRVATNSWESSLRVLGNLGFGPGKAFLKFGEFDKNNSWQKSWNFVFIKVLFLAFFVFQHARFLIIFLSKIPASRPIGPFPLWEENPRKILEFKYFLQRSPWIVTVYSRNFSTFQFNISNFKGYLQKKMDK